MNSSIVVFVTGGTGAIGKAIAGQIAVQDGYEVVLIARDREKASRVAAEIQRASGNARVSYELADLSRRASIQALAKRWNRSLHVLINNAAATPRRRLETPEGIELQFATNVLGYCWMMNAFWDHLQQAAPARVVNVASYWAGGLDLADLEFKRRTYENGQAYRQSKQADRMLTAAYAERLQADGIVVNACHPGDVNSNLSNQLGFGGSESPDEAARTPVWLAIDPAASRESGKYFEHKRQVRDRFVEDRQAVDRLYRICQSYGAESAK